MFEEKLAVFDTDHGVMNPREIPNPRGPPIFSIGDLTIHVL